MELGIRTRLWTGVALAALLILLVPTPSRTAPEWTIHLVDERGAPIADAQVMEIWQYSGWGEKGDNIVASSDESGTVRLASQKEWGNLVQRAYYHGLAAYDSHHRTYEPSAYVFAPVGERYTADVKGPTVWRGRTDDALETTLVLAPCPANAKAAAQVGCSPR